MYRNLNIDFFFVILMQRSPGKTGASSISQIRLFADETAVTSLILINDLAQSKGIQVLYDGRNIIDGSSAGSQAAFSWMNLFCWPRTGFCLTN